MRSKPKVGGCRAHEKAAQLEGSKIFTKEFLQRHGIPTAAMYGAYDSPGDAYGALGGGLAGGNEGRWAVCRKGSAVAGNPDEATRFY